MKRLISQCKSEFLQNRLSFLMQIFLMITTASAFLGPDILSVSVPLIGVLFPFRVVLPITMLLYLIWAAKGNDTPWRDSTALEKWIYALSGIMIVYGAISLFWAIDFMFSFRKLFNLCFDLCYFFLLLRLCRSRPVFRRVVAVAASCMAVLCVLGVWETFFGGIFNRYYDIYARHAWLNTYLQFPVVTSGNTNDYASMLLFVTALFLAARGLGVFGETNRVVKYVPVLLMPTVFFLITMSSSRLNLLAFWMLLAFLTVHDLLKKQMPKWIPIVTVVLVLGVLFCHQYRHLATSVQAHMEQKTSVPVEEPVLPIDKTESPQAPSLREQFFDHDQDGNVMIRESGSAGERLRLLLHAADCFVESHGLGVGLGNTEILAAQRTVVPRWAGARANSIHCFAARIIADYGVFVLIPLCAIAFLLLRRTWEMFWKGCREKNRTAIACALLLFGCAVIYPLVSTAPSDAQDNLAMWMYLAVVVLFATEPASARLDEIKGR